MEGWIGNRDLIWLKDSFLILINWRKYFFFRDSNKYYLTWLSVKCCATTLFLIQGSVFNTKFQTSGVDRKISFFWIQSEIHQSFSCLNDGLRRLELPKLNSHYWNSSWLQITISADVNQLNDSSSSTA